MVSGSSTYTYDGNGNQLSRTTDNGTAEFTYNVFNQQTQYSMGPVTAQYVYNTDGIRTSKTVNGQRTTFLLDGGNVAAEVQDGQVTATYLRGINLISQDVGYDRFYYQYNAHGDVVTLTDQTGSVAKSYDYTAFGIESDPDADDENPFRYCGEYFDSETGTYYLRARYYDPSIGRFTQPDSHWNSANRIYGDDPQKINEREDALGNKLYSYSPEISAIVQSGNLYAYALNNSIAYVDSTGELAWPGEIHNQVVYHVATKYGYNIEQRINYNVGWGRADLISPSGQVWDVKRDKVWQIASGVKQVQKYVANEWKNHPDIALSVGGEIEPDSFIYENGVTTYYVTYRYAIGGVIAYDYYEVTDWEKVGEVVSDIVTIAGILGFIYATGGAAAPVLVPQLT